MKVAAFDLDGTLLCQNSGFCFCQYLCRVKALTRADFCYCLWAYWQYRFGSFSAAGLHQKVFSRLFFGKAVDVFRPHVKAFLQTISWYQPALRRLRQLQQEGAFIQIISSGSLFLVKEIARCIGVNSVVATSYSVTREGLLDKVETFVDAEYKRKALKAHSAKDIIAFSDSHHDVRFLEQATYPVAVRPTRLLARIAHKRNWEIL